MQLMIFVFCNSGFARFGIATDALAATTVVDIRSFGAVCDGIKDDIDAVKSAAAALKSGQTLVLSKSCLMRVPKPGGIAVTLDNLSDITISGGIVNDEFGMDSPVWHPVTSLVANGKTVTVTTPEPHGQSTNTTVLIYAESDRNYKGAVTIASVLDPTHFTYSTLGGSPKRPASGKMFWASVDFSRTFFKFTRCKNVTLDLTYKGQYVDRSARHRLGYTVLAFEDANGEENRSAKINLHGSGAAYLVSVGSYRSPRLGHLADASVNLTAQNVGYALASWGGCSNSTIFIDATDVHRALYADGLQHSRIEIRVKDFDVAGAILTSHEFGTPPTNHVGCNDIVVSVTDTGTTDDTSYLTGSGGRFLVGINGYNSPGVPVFSNITMRVNLKVTDKIGRNIVAARASCEGTNAVFDQITFSGDIDRSGLTSAANAGPSYELFFRTPSAAEVRNVTMRDWHVINNPKIAKNPQFRRDIKILQHKGVWLNSNVSSDSYKAESIIGGEVKSESE